ncbi:MAG: hypothetical protein GY820_03385 [Gammaproteobacteria bacterium]|nr:hypothetical protein [Gammaproteobacteria bacterium]
MGLAAFGAKASTTHCKNPATIFGDECHLFIRISLVTLGPYTRSVGPILLKIGSHVLGYVLQQNGNCQLIPLSTSHTESPFPKMGEHPRFSK